MATTKPDVKYVKIDSVNLWANSDGVIHITTDDPDVKSGFHTYISNNTNSKRYHPSAYRQLARILTQFGKEVPGWTDDNPADG